MLWFDLKMDRDDMILLMYLLYACIFLYNDNVENYNHDTEERMLYFLKAGQIDKSKYTTTFCKLMITRLFCKIGVLTR